jgi:predicted dehydrogenase
MPPEVAAAMAEASRSFVDMFELQLAVSARIAGLIPSGAAHVSGGEAAEHASIAAEIDHFVHCVLTRRPPIAGFEEARLGLAVVREAYESPVTGQVVRLPTEGPS